MRHRGTGASEPAQHLGAVAVLGWPVEFPHRLVDVADVLLTQVGELHVAERGNPVQAAHFRVGLVGPRLPRELLCLQPASWDTALKTISRALSQVDWDSSTTTDTSLIEQGDSGDAAAADAAYEQNRVRLFGRSRRPTMTGCKRRLMPASVGAARRPA